MFTYKVKTVGVLTVAGSILPNNLESSLTSCGYLAKTRMQVMGEYRTIKSSLGHVMSAAVPQNTAVPCAFWLKCSNIYMPAICSI